MPVPPEGWMLVWPRRRSGGRFALPRRCCDVFSAPACGYALFFFVDFLGQCEKIVRRLDDDRGFQILQVLEQTVEVLKVLPEKIVSQLWRLGVEERISERSVEVIEAFPQERISGRTGEQTVDLPTLQVMESVEVFNSLGSARDVASTRLPEQIDDVIKVTSPEVVSDARVSAGHVEQAFSWFDEKYDVVPSVELSYRESGCSSCSSRCKLKWQRQARLDSRERVGSGPVTEEVVSAGPYTASMPRTKKVFAVVHLTCSLNSVQVQGSG